MSQQYYARKGKAVSQKPGRFIGALVECPDCQWHGESSELVYNGREGRTECPNCTGVDFKKVGEQKKKKVKSAIGNRRVAGWSSDASKETKYNQAIYCDCGWDGLESGLKISEKTGERICPKCGDVTNFDNDWRAGLDEAYETKHVSAKTIKPYAPCHVTHKPMPLNHGLEINGGSCLDPKVKGCDIYIGFEIGMKFTDKSFPWNEGAEVLYVIRDQNVPTKPKNFAKLVEWVAEQLQAGRTVHAGCVGGHGRTGMFFAALVSYLGVSDDPIKYVRENYCNRAVESQKQIDFLAEHYGCKKSLANKM